MSYVAEWQGKGLQDLSRQFDPARNCGFSMASNR